ncbi:MAG: EF-hand domain-containing protein [Burkholderiales bacterium]
MRKAIPMKKILFRVLAVFAVLACSTVSAMAQTAQPTVSKQIFSDADADRDGYVDLNEFHRDISASFVLLDHDHDGYITREEIGSIPDKARVKLLLRALNATDRDGDGRLSFKEVITARMAYFDQADTNHDDRISLDEALSYDALLQKRIREMRGTASGK